MNDWFTVEKIDNSTYAISEYKHWEETHCYLLVGNHTSLLIDTGLGVGNIKKVVDSLTDLPVKVVTTHAHWDHIGGHKYFKNIGIHDTEKNWLTSCFPLSLNIVKMNLTKEPCDFPEDFNIENYQIYKGNPSFLLYDNEIIQLGDREVKVIHTPGHSPGHICFYEEKQGYLYTGDLIYEGTLDAFYPSTDPFEFMNSVQKVKQLSIQRILPAHYNLNIHPELIFDIHEAFSDLNRLGKLVHGGGIYNFNKYNIHI